MVSLNIRLIGCQVTDPPLRHEWRITLRPSTGCRLASSRRRRSLFHLVPNRERHSSEINGQILHPLRHRLHHLFLPVAGRGAIQAPRQSRSLQRPLSFRSQSTWARAAVTDRSDRILYVWMRGMKYLSSKRMPLNHGTRANLSVRYNMIPLFTYSICAHPCLHEKCVVTYWRYLDAACRLHIHVQKKSTQERKLSGVPAILFALWMGLVGSFDPDDSEKSE